MPEKKQIIRLLRIVMPLVAIACMVVFVPWNGVRAWIAPLPDTLEEQVDDAIGYGIDGIIVYVDQGNRPPALYAAGWKDKTNQIPTDPEALFKIASISKLYVAVAAAKLVNSGVLSLDDTLADHLPELNGRIEYANEITMRMLLQHRSGIPNFVHDDDFDWSRQQSDPDDNLQLILDQPGEFEPDAKTRYSNTNYLLLARIIDKLLGYSHHRYISGEIFNTLGVTDTYHLIVNVDSEDVMSGYHYGNDDDLKGLEFATPGGSMVATARDVGIFLRALNDGTLLTPDEQEIYSSVYHYGHTGWLPGYQSIARYDEETDAVIVQFISTTGGDSELVAHVVYNRIKRIVKRR